MLIILLRYSIFWWSENFLFNWLGGFNVICIIFSVLTPSNVLKMKTTLSLKGVLAIDNPGQIMLWMSVLRIL